MAKPRKPYYDTPRHGTMAGLHQHKLADETPCKACKRAAADTMAEYRRKNPAKVAAYKAIALARSHALLRLQDAHPAEYERYHQEELDKIDRTPEENEQADLKWWRGLPSEPEPGYPDG